MGETLAHIVHLVTRGKIVRKQIDGREQDGQMVLTDSWYAAAS